MVYSIKYALFEGVNPTWKAPNLFSMSKYGPLVTSCDLWSQITNCSNPLRVGGGEGEGEASCYLFFIYIWQEKWLMVEPNLLVFSPLQLVDQRPNPKKNMVYGTRCRSWLQPHLMFTPESTQTHLPWATLYQSWLYPPVRDFGFGLSKQNDMKKINIRLFWTRGFRSR